MSIAPSETTDCVERTEFPLLEVVPWVLLAIATALAVGIDFSDSTKLAIDIVGSAVAALWMLWWIGLHPQWRQRPRLMEVFFVGLMAVSAVLVINDPVYGFFSWTGFLWLHEAVQGPVRTIGFFVVAAVTGTSQHGGLPSHTVGSWLSWVAIVALNVFLYGAVSRIMAKRDAEYAMRARMVDELTEANAKLEASMRENAGLHEQLLAGAREAGMLDERQRMAREIHDTLAQGLVGIITQLEEVHRHAGSGASRDRGRAAANRSGGARERRQARPRLCRGGDALRHGRRHQPRRARQRSWGLPPSPRGWPRPAPVEALG
jgi:signal transduction histidine kinase